MLHDEENLCPISISTHTVGFDTTLLVGCQAIRTPTFYSPTVRCGGTLRGFDTDTWVAPINQSRCVPKTRAIIHNPSPSIALRTHANPRPNIATHYCRLTCHRVRPCHRMERESSRINRDFARAARLQRATLHCWRQQRQVGGQETEIPGQQCRQGDLQLIEGWGRACQGRGSS